MKNVNALQVADCVTTKRYSGDQWCTFREVRDGTGFAKRTNRYADLLAMSIWPSRGIYLEGVEIKVQRSDWLRELENPKKADAFHKYCRYWFVAAPKGVVEASEVPETWGYLEVTPKRCTVQKRPKENQPEPFDSLFVASLVRHAKQSLGYSVKDIEAARRSERKVMESKFAKLTECEQEVRRLRRSTRIAREFEEISGVQLSSWNLGNVAEAIGLLARLSPEAIARQVQAMSTHINRLAAETTTLAESLDRMTSSNATSDA